VNVVDLHGRADEVQCMSCGRVSDRLEFHGSIRSMNPSISFEIDDSTHIGSEKTPPSIRPDGDGNFHMSDFTKICVPNCPLCNGIVKPTVVFFGDSVPPAKVHSVVNMVSVVVR
jgi:NAD-dependent SIR2 family protein deacetylase